MRNPLGKRIPRELVKNLGKYLGMCLILISTICVGSGFQSTMNGAMDFLENIKDQNFQEDGFFEVYHALSGETVSKLSGADFSICPNFYATENDYEKDGEKARILIFSTACRKAVDTPVLFAGAMPVLKDEIALDHCFANGRKIKIGDKITLLGKEYTVCGTVSLPDYSSLFMNNTDLVMNTSHFCVSVVSGEAFGEISSDQVTYRYSYRYKNRGLSDAEKLDLSENLMKNLVLNGEMVQSFLRRDQNQSISFLEMDIGTDGPFMTVFVYILVAVIAFVFAILTNSTIEKESVIIGTLRASGYTKGEILWHYLQPTLIMALVGSGLGNLLGYTVMIEPFLSIYYNTYSIGPIDIHFVPGTFVLTTVVPVVIMILVNYIMLARKLSLSPLKFLRRELKSSAKRRAQKLPAKWSFLNRFRARVIIQNRGNYTMLFLGVFIASFLLMFGIGLSPLMDHYTAEVDKSLPYEYQYLLKAPLPSSYTDDAPKNKVDPVLVYEMSVWFKLGQKDLSVMCYGVQDESPFFGKAIESVQGNEVAVSSALAKKLNLKVGTTLSLEDKSRDKKYDFKIGAVYPYEGGIAIYMGRDALGSLLEAPEGYYNCILAGEKLQIPEAYVVKQISRSDMLGAAAQMMDSFGTVIFFLNVFSVVVYLILMYILTKVVIDKNALSISYMKVFGYEKGEIKKLYLSATTWIVILSLVICIPLEIEMFKLVLVYLSSMIDGYMEFYLPVSVYIKIVVIGLVTYFAVNAVHVWNIKKVPMADALKNRE